MRLLMTSNKIAGVIKFLVDEYVRMFMVDEEYPEVLLDKLELNEFIDFNINLPLDCDYLDLEYRVEDDSSLYQPNSESPDETFMALACRLNEELEKKTLDLIEECYFKLTVMGSPTPGIKKLSIINTRMMEVTLSDYSKANINRF